MEVNISSCLATFIWKKKLALSISTEKPFTELSCRIEIPKNLPLISLKVNIKAIDRKLEQGQFSNPKAKKLKP